MTIYERIKARLEAEPQLRERRFSRDFLMESALGDCGVLQKWIDGRAFSLDDLKSICSKHDSWRHEWDAVTRENKELQGEDYKDGKRLAQEKQVGFGYEAGYHKDLTLNEKYDLYEPKLVK